eukprot:359937-Chlamydomonas_euryale.AAC.15
MHSRKQIQWWLLVNEARDGGRMRQGAETTHRKFFPGSVSKHSQGLAARQSECVVESVPRNTPDGGDVLRCKRNWLPQHISVAQFCSARSVDKGGLPASMKYTAKRQVQKPSSVGISESLAKLTSDMVEHLPW